MPSIASKRNPSGVLVLLEGIGVYTRIRAFTVGDFDEGPGLLEGRRKHYRCHDCGCKPGDVHYYGCDAERCPECKGQLITCGHLEGGP